VGLCQQLELLIPHVAVEQPAVHQDDGRLTRSGDLVVNLALAEFGDAGIDCGGFLDRLWRRFTAAANKEQQHENEQTRHGQPPYEGYGIPAGGDCSVDLPHVSARFSAGTP
jgi:hypothetical protein